jgi:hypothetical protein
MTGKFGIRAIGNVMIGKGTFIKAPGYQHPIETIDNLHIGDGTFIDTSYESEEPHHGVDASGGDGKTSRRLIDLVLFPVIATLIAAAITGAITYFRPQFAH